MSLRGTSHCGSIRGVRSSLPGDIEKITQAAGRTGKSARR